MNFRLVMSGVLLAGLIASTASAQLFPYSTDFESTGSAYPTADGLFIGDGWTFFATQPPPIGGSYFEDSPNGPQISALGSFDMNQWISVYGDYDNPGRTTFPTFVFDTSVFQQRAFSAADAATGATWTFNFDWKHADSGAPSGSSTAAAFIRVFDGSFNLLDEQLFSTTAQNASFPGFDPGSLEQVMNPAWNTGGFIQWGFTNSSIAFEGTGVFYDNVEFTDGSKPPVATPLSTFCSDFEDLVPDSLFLPIGDGWTFFATDPVGSYDGPAPQGPQISNLADASGDPGNTLFQENGTDDDSNQYLNIYSDYDNPLRPTGQPFGNNVFQQQTFTAADAALGQTYTFSFDYAGGQDPFGVANDPTTTSAAFIRVFDGAFNLLDEAEFNTSDAPSTPMGASPTIVFEHGKVSVTMDPAWEDGGIIQFGFTTTSTLFLPTGVYYDNVCFGVLGDANNDGVFNNSDIAGFVMALTVNPPSPTNGILDMNCDGEFNNSDIAAFVAALTGGGK